MKHLLVLILAALWVLPVHASSDVERAKAQAELNRIRSQARGNKPIRPTHSNQTQYALSVKSHLMKHWNLKSGEKYPEDLKMAVNVKIRQDGVVIGKEVETPSGNKDFTLEVFKAISRAAPFPDKLKEDQLEFGLRFSPAKGGG